MDTYIPHSWPDSIPGCHVVQRASRRHLFGSCQGGDVSLLPLRRVTLDNVVDVSILGLTCELDQGLICASLDLATHTRQTDRGASNTKFHRWFLVFQGRGKVHVGSMVLPTFQCHRNAHRKCVKWVY